MLAAFPPLRHTVPSTRRQSDVPRALIRIYGPVEALRIAKACLNDCIPPDCSEAWEKYVEEISKIIDWDY